MSNPERVEVATIILLGLAALITAWAAFQSSLWSGVSLDKYAMADARQNEAGALRDAVITVAQADEAVFLEYIKAARSGDTQLAGLIKREIMAKRVRDAVDVWERVPVASREASPLSHAYGYSVPGRDASTERMEAARATVAEARRASGIGDEYNLAAVILAASLFLLGISSTLRVPRFRMSLLVLGGLTLLSASAWLFTLSVQNPL